MNSYHNFRGASGGMSCTLLYCFAYVRPRDCNSGSKGFKAWKLLSKFLRSQIFQKINLCSCSDLAGPASLLYPTQIFEILTPVIVSSYCILSSGRDLASISWSFARLPKHPKPLTLQLQHLESGGCIWRARSCSPPRPCLMAHAIPDGVRRCA